MSQPMAEAASAGPAQPMIDVFPVVIGHYDDPGLEPLANASVQAGSFSC